MFCWLRYIVQQVLSEAESLQAALMIAAERFSHGKSVLLEYSPPDWVKTLIEGMPCTCPLVSSRARSHGAIWIRGEKSVR